MKIRTNRHVVLAALVVIATLVAACGGGKHDSRSDAASATTSTAPRASTSTTSTTPARAVTDAAGAAKRWLTAVAKGDDQTALALLSPRSLAKIGGAGGWQKMKIELSEGWGAWGRADGVEMTARALLFPKDVMIVVLHGNVSQEGPPRESWNALPVVATDSGDRVEAFLDVATVTVDPKEGGELVDGDEVKITTSTSNDVYVLVDDQPAVMPELRDVDASGAHWGLVPPALPPGLHAVTVVLTGDGVQATRFEYTVH